MGRAYAGTREGDGAVKVARLSKLAVAALCAVGWGLTSTCVALSAELPDGRVQEQVTPEEKLGSEVYQPPLASTNYYNLELKGLNTDQTETEFTFEAAAGGGKIAYVAGPTVEGNENSGWFGGNEYVASRSTDGTWSQRDISPENAPDAVFQAFSPDLSSAFFDAQTPLSPLLPGFGEEFAINDVNYDLLYSTSTDGRNYEPLFTTTPPYRAKQYFGTSGTHKEPERNGTAHRAYGKFLALEGMSADDTHLLFAANDALTEASEGRPAAEGGEEPQFESEDNLYESIDGHLRLVNVLPNGTTHANATFGAAEVLGPHSEKRTTRVISADGSRVFWTDLSTGHIYVREDGTRTVEISPEGTYQTATNDGSTVFYTNGDLYAYEVGSGHTTDLTPGVAVERVVGSSENGEYIYYITTAKELVVWHKGVSTPIGPVEVGGFPLTAEVTPDGRSIVYSQSFREGAGAEEVETYRVHVYDAETATLYCASCTGHGTFGGGEYGDLSETNSENVYQPRWISANGARVFFVSLEGLVPQDTNEVQDVYEWERPGTGGCADSHGCVYLLSGGTSVGHSYFLDASENGEDVFIATRADLSGGDEDGLYDLYDVRVGHAPPAPPACTGSGCQGLPSAPPIFATPSSVTFEGVGNFVSTAKTEQGKPKSNTKGRSKERQSKKKHKAKRGKHKGKGSRKSKSVRAARAGAKGGRS